MLLLLSGCRREAAAPARSVVTVSPAPAPVPAAAATTGPVRAPVDPYPELPTEEVSRLQGFRHMIPFIVEREGAKLRALFEGGVYEGELTNGKNFVLRTTNGSKEVALRGEARKDGFFLVQQFSDDEQDFYDAESSVDLPEGEEQTLLVSIGSRPVRMRIVCRDGALTGVVGDPAGGADLLLRGKIDGAHVELRAFDGAEPKAILRGLIAAPDAWLGRWEPTNGAGSETFVVDGAE